MKLEISNPKVSYVDRINSFMWKIISNLNYFHSLVRAQESFW